MDALSGWIDRSKATTSDKVSSEGLKEETFAAPLRDIFMPKDRVDLMLSLLQQTVFDQFICASDGNTVVTIAECQDGTAQMVINTARSSRQIDSEAFEIDSRSLAAKNLATNNAKDKLK